MLNSTWYFNVYKNQFSHEWCDQVIEHAYENAEQSGEAEFGFDGRSCNIRWIAQPWIFDEIAPKIARANEECKWNFAYEYLEPLQYTEYEIGHEYRWHIDTYPHVKEGNIQRKLSFSIMLSDRSEYEGGDMHFVSGLPNNEKEYDTPVSLEKGDIVVFPSYVPHKVNIVGGGLRRSLVGWTMGPAWR